MDFNEIIIQEIRENRKKIDALKDAMWGLKLKIVVVSTTLAVLINLGILKWLLP